MATRMKELFDYNKNEEFPGKLVDWIGQVFYDILPEHGYEVREEQIYTAFQLADAVCNKKIHLAEAGLGTGKTFAYLLTAIAYARFSGKPVVIACASTALQEQLAGPKGDIQTLSQILGIEIDARMAKDPRQYVCDVRVDDSRGLFTEKSNTMLDEINRWLEKTKRGERSEIPLVPDRVWRQIGWDETMSCDLCASHGFCKLVKAREHYRPARDLIIADHGIFFEDLWTRDERIDDGKLPVLPNYSAVIFDEGHKVMLPAAMRAGQGIFKEDIDNITETLSKLQGARNSLISSTVALEDASNDFFQKLNKCIIEDTHSDRLAIGVDDKLLRAAKTLHKTLDQMLLELEIEQELYIELIPISLLKVYEAQIERSMLALHRFLKNGSKDVIIWVDPMEGSFWVVPRNLHDMLNRKLFQNKLPVVFTSATLSNEGDFSYFTRTLGLKNPSTSTVESPFDIENQVVAYIPEPMVNDNDLRLTLDIEQLVALLKGNKGSALVLANSLDEVRKIRKDLKEFHLPFEVLYEDQGERGYLVRRFREEVSSVLVGAGFWEGIDVPGESLSLLIVWQLPFPSLDPLIEVQRKEAREAGLDPLITVDYPEMGLKLKQGCGRLIRTKDDHGAIVIMDRVKGTPYEQIVMGSLPKGAKLISFDELLNNQNRENK